VDRPAVGVAAVSVDEFASVTVTNFSTQVGEAKVVVSRDTSTQTDQPESNFGRRDFTSQYNTKKFKDASV
jgi:hypothetical protein